MKKKVFLVILIVLQLAFPLYFFVDASVRESKVYTHGNEYKLRFSSVVFSEQEQMTFNIEECYRVENPSPEKYYYISDVDELHWYFNLAVAKDDKGETLFYDADTLTKRELAVMDKFPSAGKRMDFDIDDFDFCGSIKDKRELYNFLIENVRDVENKQELPTYEEYISDDYEENYFYYNYPAYLDGSLKVKLYKGVMKITEVSFGDETVLRLK